MTTERVTRISWQRSLTATRVPGAALGLVGPGLVAGPAVVNGAVTYRYRYIEPDMCWP